MSVSDVAHLRIVVLDSVRFKLGEKLPRALLVKMLDASATAGRHDLEFVGVNLEKPGHEGTSPVLQVAQHTHFVGEALFRLGAAKRLVHAAVIADANLRPESVLYLVHA